jgi:uncharacterized membrane protein
MADSFDLPQPTTKDWFMRQNSRFNTTTGSDPFIGHAGVGSRLTIKPEGRGFSILPSLGSQLWLIFSLLAMILVPAYAYFFDRASIRGGAFGYSILAIMEVFAIPFFLKFSFQLLGRRRIHVDPVLQKIYLYSSGTTASRAINFASISKTEIRRFVYRSDQSETDNFTVTIVDRDEQTIELCTSDKESEATQIEQRLSQVIGLKSIS